MTYFIHKNDNNGSICYLAVRNMLLPLYIIEQCCHLHNPNVSDITVHQSINARRHALLLPIGLITTFRHLIFSKSAVY